MLNVLLFILAGAVIGFGFAWHKTRGMVATANRVKSERDEFVATARDAEEARVHRLGAAYTVGSIRGARLGAGLMFAGFGALAGALIGLVLYFLGVFGSPDGFGFMKRRMPEQNLSTDQKKAQIKNDCMMAIGGEIFCSCIADMLPSDVTSFSVYVQIASTTKDQFQYDTLSPRDRKSVDSTHAARDLCLNWPTDGPGK